MVVQSSDVQYQHQSAHRSQEKQHTLLTDKKCLQGAISTFYHCYVVSIRNSFPVLLVIVVSTMHTL